MTPDDGRKFTELYNVQHLTSNTLDPVCRVCITTIQRLFSMLKGEPELDEELEEKSIFDISPDGKPLEVTYNPKIPIETFDFIITDECHRSIYNLWRQVLEYFRRLPYRPHSNPIEADPRLFQPEPCHGI